MKRWLIRLIADKKKKKNPQNYYEQIFKNRCRRL